MKFINGLVLFIGSFFFSTSFSNAQVRLNTSADSIRQLAKVRFQTDSTNAVNVLKSRVNSLGNNIKSAISPLKDQQYGDKVRGQISEVKKKLANQLPSLKKPPIQFAIGLEDAVRYQPLSVQPFVLAGPKFANVINVRGDLILYGIPLNVDFSTDRGSSAINSATRQGLFKFNFNPARLSELYNSDVKAYFDLKQKAFGGLDLNTYTQAAIKNRLGEGVAALNQQVHANVLASYLNDPRQLTGLLGLNKNQIVAKLRREVTDAGLVTEVIDISKDISIPGVLTSKNLLKISALKVQSSQLKLLSQNERLRSYFNDPEKLNELRLMNIDQIGQKLNKAAPLVEPDTGLFTMPNHLMTDTVIDINAFIRTELRQRRLAHQEMVQRISQRLFLSARGKNSVDFQKVLTEQGDNLTGQTTRLATLPSSVSSKNILPDVDREIEGIAASVTEVRQKLASKGIDPEKMFRIQQYLDDSELRGGMSEQTGSLFNARPANAVQSLFTHLSALKVGSFSSRVPGGVQSQELFMTGGQTTLKTGFIPVTLGYGSVNDINSAKDGGLLSSVYNQPRNITFLGAELKRGGRGNLKISVISSINSQSRSSLYAIPTISSNNVAFTLSKGINMGDFGNVAVDLSKSTTLYANKFQVGNEAILDKKGGLNYNLSNDLFQALSFGATHTLEVQKIQASDNIYFNYAGLGYQNPANNGFGGAKMKFGGNFKKGLYKNKLTLNFRSDFTNMPISYTSDDRWKSYRVQMDGRYQVNRRFNLNFKYTSNGTSKRVAGLSSAVYGFQKLQVDGNSSYKIGKFNSVSHFSVGGQQISGNMGATTVASSSGRLLLLNYVQSVVIHSNVLSFTMFYNRELSTVKLIGNMLNTDMSYQYRLFKKLGVSSGMTFLDNSGIARQVGLRQSVQLYSAGNFDLGSFIDYRKNLITPLYADLYPTCRAELSLRYRINR